MADNNDPQDEERPPEAGSDRMSEVGDDQGAAGVGFDPPLDDTEDDDLDDHHLNDDDLDEDGYGERWADDGSVFVLRARQPFEDWVRGVLGEGPTWRLPPIKRCHAILTPELPTQEDADEWLQQHFAGLFAGQLDIWTEDESAWPVTTLETFLDWFDVVFAPTVDDYRGPDEETDRPPRAVTCAPLSLRQVLAEFLQLPLDGSLHVEIASGELFAWTDDELEAIHAGDAADIDLPPDDMRELQETFASESLIEIVHRADVDNPDTMVAFVATVESQAIRNRLLGALQGKRARRRFIQALEIARLRHRWTAWFERTAADTLRDFLNQRGVPYVDDMASTEPEAQGDEDEET